VQSVKSLASPTQVKLKSKLYQEKESQSSIQKSMSLKSKVAIEPKELKRSMSAKAMDDSISTFHSFSATTKSSDRPFAPRMSYTTKSSDGRKPNRKSKEPKIKDPKLKKMVVKHRRLKTEVS